LGLLKCKYPSNPHLPGPDRTYQFIVTSSNESISPTASSFSTRSLSLEVSPVPEPFFPNTNEYFKVPQTPGLSDVELYDHYLQHTSRTLSPCQSDYNVMYMGMPKLAQQSETVLHAILAVAAADIAWNMISDGKPAEFEAVAQALLTGYQHYNLASEQMRQAIVTPGSFEPEPLIASTLMLIPFATASQQVNHWLSSRSGATNSCKPLSSTPRDVIVIMRGVRAMLQAADDVDSGTIIDPFPKAKEELSDSYSSVADTPIFAVPAQSRKHLMSAIVSTTSRAAFARLQNFLDFALLHDQNCSYHSLLACTAAFANLKTIRKAAFDVDAMNRTPGTTPPTQLPSPGMDFGGPEIASASSIAPWLRSFAAQFCVASSVDLQPTEPLTRFFLSFYIQAPQEYLDVVLPLLDQRLESPIDRFPSGLPTELTQTQALALDIYAHWSVLMILVEEESWWIGTLPEVTLSGMLNRFGDDFVSKGWPANGVAKGEWWPGKMLSILRDIKKYR